MNYKELIFHQLKDEPVIAKKMYAKYCNKYNLTQKEVQSIFVKINNYQIKKYGNKLNLEDVIFSKEQNEKNQHNSQERRYARKVKRQNERIS